MKCNVCIKCIIRSWSDTKSLWLIVDMLAGDKLVGGGWFWSLPHLTPTHYPPPTHHSTLWPQPGGFSQFYPTTPTDHNKPTKVSVKHITLQNTMKVGNCKISVVQNIVFHNIFKPHKIVLTFKMKPNIWFKETRPLKQFILWEKGNF